MGETPEALTYEPEEQLTPLPIDMQLQEPQDEVLPYEVLLPISSSSSDTEEDGRPLAIDWSGQPEAGGSRLRPRPVVHPEDAKWIKKKRAVPSDSSEEEREVKVPRGDPDYRPPGVQSVWESWQEKQEAEALETTTDLAQQVRKVHKIVNGKVRKVVDPAKYFNFI